ncbi:hypothetical protein A4X09_0g5647 [Tilletia walkeri]|uniref:Uncharacterized protein n=1 Tax=Tilletia walkeri TaxID=117179 RepID=A0A8X7T346_9BASI|nr:hypothetical protein A4X09_0g5647 [Tilletia walkeri]
MSTSRQHRERLVSCWCYTRCTIGVGPAKHIRARTRALHLRADQDHADEARAEGFEPSRRLLDAIGRNLEAIQDEDADAGVAGEDEDDADEPEDDLDSDEDSGSSIAGSNQVHIKSPSPAQDPEHLLSPRSQPDDQFDGFDVMDDWAPIMNASPASSGRASGSAQRMDLSVGSDGKDDSEEDEVEDLLDFEDAEEDIEEAMVDADGWEEADDSEEGLGLFDSGGESDDDSDGSGEDGSEDGDGSDSERAPSDNEEDQQQDDADEQDPPDFGTQSRHAQQLFDELVGNYRPGPPPQRPPDPRTAAERVVGRLTASEAATLRHVRACIRTKATDEQYRTFARNIELANPAIKILGKDKANKLVKKTFGTVQQSGTGEDVGQQDTTAEESPANSSRRFPSSLGFEQGSLLDRVTATFITFPSSHLKHGALKIRSSTTGRPARRIASSLQMGSSTILGTTPSYSAPTVHRWWRNGSPAAG